MNTERIVEGSNVTVDRVSIQGKIHYYVNIIGNFSVRMDPEQWKDFVNVVKLADKELSEGVC